MPAVEAFVPDLGDLVAVVHEVDPDGRQVLAASWAELLPIFQRHITLS